MIEPVGKTVLLKLDKLEDVDPVWKQAKAAGIEIPDMNEKQRESRAVDSATVIAVSPHAWQDWFDGSPWAAKGDKVLIAKYSGKTVKSDGEEYTLINDEDVLAVIRE